MTQQITQAEIRARWPKASASLLRQNAAPATSLPEPEQNVPQDFKEPGNAYVGKEKDLHALFLSDMNRRGCHCVYSRTDTAASISPGLPDFHVMFFRELSCLACAVEFKVSGGKVKPHQREKIMEMRAKGIPVLVAWDLASAINFVRENLGC